MVRRLSEKIRLGIIGCGATTENAHLPAALASATVELTDRKSTRLNSSHLVISYAVFCLKKKILQGDRDHAISEEVSRLRHPDPPGNRAVLRREEELSHDEPVQPIDFECHAANLLDVRLRIPGDDAERELLHAGRQVMESPEETVDGEPRRLDEILDRDEFRALVHNRESGEAADRLVDFLQLTRGQLLSTPKADRVTSNDVIAGNHSRKRLRPAPFIRVDRRLRGDRIFLQRPDPHAEASVVLDREAQEGAGANPVRRGPVFRERDPEARIAELLDLAGFELHGSAYIRARINTYSV